MAEQAVASRTLIGLRDALVICLSWECMLRAKELVALDAADVKVKRKRARLVVRTKRHPEGDPDVPDASRLTAEMARTWLTAADIDRGAVFRGMSKSGRVLDARLSTRALSHRECWRPESRDVSPTVPSRCVLYLPAAVVRPPPGGWP